MAERNKTLMCRRCEVRAELVSEDGARELIRCPSCGMAGDAEEIARLAIEHAQQSLVHGAIEDFQRGMARSTKRHKNVTYRPGKLSSLVPPDFIYR